jgi:hypothetical protein
MVRRWTRELVIVGARLNASPGTTSPEVDDFEDLVLDRSGGRVGSLQSASRATTLSEY